LTQTVLVQKKDGRRRPLTEEHKAKISVAHTGKTLSEEHRAKIGAALTGENNPAKRLEVKAKLSALWTLERKAKHNEFMMGENNPMNRPEVAAKQSAAQMGENNHNYGKAFSEETRAKMSVSKMGENNPMKRPEVRAKIKGENNSSWKGGISFLPYCPKFDNLLKEQYRNLYGRICGYCGKSELENGCRLSIHHIDGNKMQGCDDHDWVLIPLCRSCNSKGFERKPEYVFLFWLKDIERKHRSGH